ncbi:ATP-binding protein [Yoonia sp. GPGPB17]|uniref:ATP-binding protein n=1 Tax=Yoonia sp. GPGPB17 TaxID=3026147 RepID=UPI0030BED6FF
MTGGRVIRWRIGVMFIIGFLAVVTIPIALFYALRGPDITTALPPPSQLQAMVRLAEEASPQERIRAFEALRSAQMSVRVASDAEVETNLELLWSDDHAQSGAYRAALGARALAVYALPRSLFSNGFGRPLWAVEFRVGLKTGGVLIVAYEGAALFTPAGVPVGFPTAFLGVLIAFVTLLWLNREFRAVLRLARAVETLDPANPDAALPDIRAGSPEVRLLIEAFQKQQAQVSTLLKARSALIGGIQHDVRTFATRLRLRIEKLASIGDRRQAETDITDLVSLMDGALLATRSEAGRLDLELIDFADLVADEVEDRWAAGFKIDLAVAHTKADYEVLADRVALRRVLFNLVENALRYGTSAHVAISANEHCVTLYVDDEGPGIPKDSRDELMQPFSRLEASRSRQTGGPGWVWLSFRPLSLPMTVMSRSWMRLKVVPVSS